MDNLEDGLRERMLEVQGASDKRSLCNTYPQKWMNIASLLLAGDSIKMIRENLGCDFYTVKAIEAQLSGELAQLAEIRAKEVEVLEAMNDDLLKEKMNKMAEAGEVDLNDAKTIKEMSATGMMLGQRKDRLRGRADTIVETREAPTPEKLQEDLEAMFNAIPQAEIIEDE